MAKRNEEFIGTYERDLWRSPDRACIIGKCEGEMKVVISGASEATELVPGMTYRFLGHYEDHSRGRQFKVQQFQIREPNSRRGLTTYLARYAPHIGPAIAGQLFDAFGSDAVMVLRTDPVRAAMACRSLTADKAEAAADALQELVKFEETRIALMNLFAGRGFPNSLIEECIKKWKILAAARVARDPFTMLVNDLGGAGFARCDRLYIDLGLNPRKLKRQVICLWNELQSSMDGHTWFPLEPIVRRLGEIVGGVKVNAKKALRLGVRSGWLAVHTDSEGVHWLASGKNAESEEFLAERVCELLEAGE